MWMNHHKSYQFWPLIMNRFLYHKILISILIYSAFYLLYAEDTFIVEPWKIDLQILLGFSDEQIDGVMGKETFESLKKFAIQNDLTDVVMRGEFEDLGFWGFQQYIMKYHQYWIRKLKNNQIIEDVSKKEYIRQAEETLYSFEIAIQNAQLEVERLTHAKMKARRLAKEKQAMEQWQHEKQEVEQMIIALNKAILTAEEEAEKWSLERIRAQRLAEEQEQLARLDERKIEAGILTSDLIDAINVAKREIDRLVEENKKLKTLITTTADTRQIADELKTDLHTTRIQMDSLYSRKIVDELKTDLEATRIQLDSLSTRKDSLEKTLKEIEVEVVEKMPPKKKKWYKRIWPFSKD